jgi:hypothetical protein
MIAAAIGAVWAVQARIPEYLISGHRCSDAEARMAESLSRNPLLTQPPPGIKPIPQPAEVYQPCEGNNDNRYYGGAVRGFNLPKTTPTLGEIEAYYRTLATANGWQVTKPATGELVGQKIIDDTAMVFHLYQLLHEKYYTAYWIELRYAELGSKRYLRTIEDTF